MTTVASRNYPAIEQGPCVVCQAPTRRYGPQGSPACPSCAEPEADRPASRPAPAGAKARNPQRQPEPERQLELFI